MVFRVNINSLARKIKVLLEFKEKKACLKNFKSSKQTSTSFIKNSQSWLAFCWCIILKQFISPFSPIVTSLEQMTIDEYKPQSNSLNTNSYGMQCSLKSFKECNSVTWKEDSWPSNYLTDLPSIFRRYSFFFQINYHLKMKKKSCIL